MGDIFEVYSWECVAAVTSGSLGDYIFVKKYAGDNKEEAFAKMEGLKAAGAKCVKLEWR